MDRASQQGWKSLLVPSCNPSISLGGETGSRPCILAMRCGVGEAEAEAEEIGCMYAHLETSRIEVTSGSSTV